MLISWGVFFWNFTKNRREEKEGKNPAKGLRLPLEVKVVSVINNSYIICNSL